MDDVREGLVLQWRALYDCFVEAGHVPLTRRSGSGSALDDEWRDFDGRQVGIQCRTCGYAHRLGHARTLPVITCDGPAGKGRRLRERADVEKEAWLRAEDAARAGGDDWATENGRSMHRLKGIADSFARAEAGPVVLVNRGQPELVVMSVAEFRRLKQAAGEPVPSEAMPRTSVVIRRKD